MMAGSHAVDGSFRRDAAVRIGRAAALLIVLVVVAVLILHHIGHTSARSTVATGGGSGGGHHTGTTARGPSSTTTPTTAPASSTTAAASTTTTVPISQVKVVVTNGTTKNKAAAFFKTSLAAKGFNTIAAVNATSHTATTSVVYYQPGFAAQAAAVAKALGLAATDVAPYSSSAPLPTTATAGNVIVLIGSNLAAQAT